MKSREQKVLDGIREMELSQAAKNMVNNTGLEVVVDLYEGKTAEEIEEMAMEMSREYALEKVYDEDGNEVYFDGAVALMDDEIRERLHMEMAPCSPQDFFDAYCKEHEKKFGEAFAW